MFFYPIGETELSNEIADSIISSGEFDMEEYIKEPLEDIKSRAVDAGYGYEAANGEKIIPSFEEGAFFATSREALRRNRMGFYNSVPKWSTQLAEANIYGIRRELQRAMNTGMSMKDLVGKMQSEMEDFQFPGGKAKMQQIARTELGNIQNAGDNFTYEQVDFVERKEWIAAFAENSRPDHLAADGQKVAKDEMFTVGGVKMKHPNDTNAPANQVVNCLCIMAPLLDEEMLGDSHKKLPMSKSEKAQRKIAKSHWKENKEELSSRHLGRTTFYGNDLEKAEKLVEDMLDGNAPSLADIQKSNLFKETIEDSFGNNPISQYRNFYHRCQQAAMDSVARGLERSGSLGRRGLKFIQEYTRTGYQERHFTQLWYNDELVDKAGKNIMREMRKKYKTLHDFYASDDLYDVMYEIKSNKKNYFKKTIRYTYDDSVEDYFEIKGMTPLPGADTYEDMSFMLTEFLGEEAKRGAKYSRSDIRMIMKDENRLPTLARLKTKYADKATFSALDAMPNYKGEYAYRGMRANFKEGSVDLPALRAYVQELEESLKNGTTMRADHVTSFTTSKNVAERFGPSARFMDETEAVMIRVRNPRKLKNISHRDITGFVDEEEVLMKHGQEFRVVEVKRVPKKSGIKGKDVSVDWDEMLKQPGGEILFKDDTLYDYEVIIEEVIKE
tara:strand:+ start:1270 stop:3276 length:2007 start_codon:yes stop_codon:yes gene_type:complete